MKCMRLTRLARQLSRPYNTTTMSSYQLNPEQLRKQAERKAAKEARQTAIERGQMAAITRSKEETAKRRVWNRGWVQIPKDGSNAGGSRCRIISWNMLAQTLVRRELFLGSDCLKFGDRKPMLQQELENYGSADIICLQECDRLNDLLVSLPSHDHLDTRGPGKLHGLVIFYRKSRYRVRASRTVYLDDEELSPSASTPGERRGGTRQTKNVGLIACLEDIQGEGGVVLATTHLFWHPKYGYEKVRQVIVLLRAILAFRAENDAASWPTVLAGDLNTTPCEAAYQLLTSPHKPLPPTLIEEIETSSVIHSTVDRIGQIPSTSSSISGTGSNTPNPQNQSSNDDEDEKEGEGNADTTETSIPGTRHPIPSDGIRSPAELAGMIQELIPDGLKSAYGSTPWSGIEGCGETFEQRGGFEGIREDAKGLGGGGEIGWSCFTALFSLTLDYLLVFPRETEVKVTGLLRPVKKEELGEGLPRLSISASDHLAVGCDLKW